MDEGNQPLTGQEQQQMQQAAIIQQAEQDTGKVAAPRTATKDPSESELDPRFDRDDLRQGKPPPAVKKHHLRPRKIKIRRPRAKKGLPFKKHGEPGAEGATTDNEADDADLTEDEVEVVDDTDNDVEDGKATEDDKGEKKGLLKKILNSNSTTSDN